MLFHQEESSREEKNKERRRKMLFLPELNCHELNPEDRLYFYLKAFYLNTHRNRDEEKNTSVTLWILEARAINTQNLPFNLFFHVNEQRQRIVY